MVKNYLMIQKFKGLEVSSKFFSLIALLALFALPFVLSVSISSNSVLSTTGSSVGISNPIIVYRYEGDDYTALGPSQVVDDSNVLGVYDFASKDDARSIFDFVDYNLGLQKLFESFGLSSNAEKNSVILRFDHKGDLDKTRILTVRNNLNESLVFNIKVSHESSQKDNKDVSRGIFLNGLEFNLRDVPKSFVVSPGQKFDIHIRLKNTPHTSYTVEVSAFKN